VIDSGGRRAIFIGMTTEVNEANFQAEVLDFPLPVLVDFWTEFCAPCRILVPVLEQLTQEMAGRAKVVKIDAFANTALAVRYGVRVVPNLLFFKHGEVKDQFIGVNVTKDQLRAKLEALM
jgi:thioredoxin 1